MILEHQSPALTAEQGFDISPEKDLTCSSNLASQLPLARRSAKAHECGYDDGSGCTTKVRPA